MESGAKWAIGIGGTLLTALIVVVVYEKVKKPSALPSPSASVKQITLQPGDQSFSVPLGQQFSISLPAGAQWNTQQNVNGWQGNTMSGANATGAVQLQASGQTGGSTPAPGTFGAGAQSQGPGTVGGEVLCLWQDASGTSQNSTISFLSAS